MTRVAAALLWLAWVAIMSTALAIRWLHSDPRLPGELPFAAVMLMFVTAGGVLVAARPRNPIGWLLCAMALLDAQNRLGSAVAANLPQLLSGSHLAASAVALSYVLSQYTLLTLITVLLLLFPDGRLLSPRWRPVAIAPLVIGVTAALVSLLAAGPVRPNVGEIAKPFGLPELVPMAELLKGLVFLSGVLGIVLGAASLFRRYRSGGPAQRQQIKWMIASASLIALFFLTVLVMLVIRFFLPGAVDDSVVPPIVNVGNLLAALSLPVAITIAILRYRYAAVSRFGAFAHDGTLYDLVRRALPVPPLSLDDPRSLFLAERVTIEQDGLPSMTGDITRWKAGLVRALTGVEPVANAYPDAAPLTLTFAFAGGRSERVRVTTDAYTYRGRQYARPGIIGILGYRGVP